MHEVSPGTRDRLPAPGGPTSPLPCRARISPYLLLIFAGCLGVYHANGHPIAEVDCVAAPYTAWALSRHGSLDLEPYPELRRLGPTHVLQTADGSWVSIRPPGSALAAVPFVAPLALVRDEPLSPRGMLIMGKVAASSCVAAAAAVFWLLCRRVAPTAAIPATLLFAFGTCMWSVASQALWTHGPATLWLTCALALLLREPAAADWKGSTLAGLALGLAVLSRSSTAVFAVAAGLALVARREYRAAGWLALGGAAPVAALCAINWLYFGDVVRGGYAHDNWETATPLPLGLAGLLVAPSRGLLVYTPAFLLAPLGLLALGRRDESLAPGQRGMILGFLGAALLTVVFYARWYDWWGGWSYGPRFLCEITPVCCLLFALAYGTLRPGWQRHLATALVVLSITVHLLGVAGHGGYVAWQQRHPSYGDRGWSLFSVRDTQIAAHATALLQKVHVLPRPASR